MRRIKQILGISVAVFVTACHTGDGDFDATGVFEATEVLVSAEANGKIKELNLQEGQMISPGEPVGWIDTLQLSLKKQQLRANKQVMQSRYQDVPRQVAALEEQIERLKNEQKRFENLVQSDAANQKQLDDLRWERLIEEKRLRAQLENLNNANSGISGELHSLDWQVAQLDDQIGKSLIASPIKGTVLAKYVEAGELATPGRALFKVADVNHLFLRAYITADQLTKIKIGQTVKVYGDSGEKERREYPGIITWISDQSEFTPKTIQTRDERANLVYAIKIAVSNDGYLKQGMYGDVRLYGRSE